MPRRKQSNPQPVKLECEDGAVVCDPGCLVLESDFLLSEELEFGDAEIMGLDRDSGMAVFSLSVENDPAAPEDSAFPSFLSCRGCGQLLGDTPLGAGLAIGEGLDLGGAGLYCLACEGGGVQSEPHAAQEEEEEEESSSAGQSGGGRAARRRRGKAGAEGGAAAASKLHPCSLCSFQSRYSNHLKRHMRTHDGEKPYRCAVCPYASAQRVNLQRHARTHTGEKPYQCPLCSYACSSLGNLRRHQRMHAQDGRPTPQGQRDKEKRRRKKRRGAERGEAVLSDLTLRVSEGSSFLHGLGPLGSPSAPLPALLFPLCCCACGRSLEPDEAPDEGEAEVCRRCSSAQLLPQDPGPASSAGPRPRRPPATAIYRCPSCPFLSHYPNHLARHAHTHSGHKPHRCADCPFASAHLDNLKRHRRVHTGEKPYQCASCSYACGNLANLRRHERVHSGAKPFRCAVCGYSCNQSVNLRRHMLRHTGEKPYQCAECPYATGHWDNYKRHQRKHGHNTDSWDKHDGHSWVTGTGRTDAHGQGDGDM